MIERDLLQGFGITARAALAVDFRLNELGAPSMAFEHRHISHVVVEQHRAIIRYERNAHISPMSVACSSRKSTKSSPSSLASSIYEAKRWDSSVMPSEARESSTAYDAAAKAATHTKRHRRSSHHNGGCGIMGKRMMREKAQTLRTLPVFGGWFFLVGNRSYHHRPPTLSGDSPPRTVSIYVEASGHTSESFCEAFAHGRQPCGFRPRCCSPHAVEQQVARHHDAAIFHKVAQHLEFLMRELHLRACRGYLVAGNIQADGPASTSSSPATPDSRWPA